MKNNPMNSVQIACKALNSKLILKMRLKCISEAKQNDGAFENSKAKDK
jgi:hypothetical protein